LRDTVKIQELPLRTIALALLLASSGCAAISSSSQTNNPASQIDVQVADAPPPDKTETDKPASPGFGYIWVTGYWDYLDGNYIWRNGRWVQAKPDYEYVRARYDHTNGGWVFHRPHWKRRHSSAATANAPGTQS
jgi:hypothetical protein